MISGAKAAMVGWTERGQATVTSPAPERRAANAAIAAAPAFPTEPPITRMCPSHPCVSCLPFLKTQHSGTQVERPQYPAHHNPGSVLEENQSVPPQWGLPLCCQTHVE